MRRYLGFFTVIPAVLMLAACGGGGTSPAPVAVAPPSPPLPPPPAPPPPPSSVTISGQIEFERVPEITGGPGLDYNNITPMPARGVTVQAIDAGGNVVETDVTDISGNYSLTVSSQTDVSVRVRAEMVQSATASWNVRVTDNTNSNALYTVDGNLTSSGVTDSTRDILISAGWTGTNYVDNRQAAPFAILDSIYDTFIAFATVDPDINFPSFFIRWSENNRPADGEEADGEIRTSFYRGSTNEIFLLGAQDVDTEEYDPFVIIHEFGHYYENNFSRSDSIGGPHTLSSRLDARIAFGEGWASALVGMVRDNPIVEDNSGPQQSSGFGFSLNTNIISTSGWFNELSVASILYDIFDANNIGPDNLTLGFEPLHLVFTDPAYRNGTPFTTLYSYIDAARRLFPGNDAALDALLGAHSISGTGPFGEGETNDGLIASSLPVYKAVTLNGPAVEVCSVDDQGIFNRHGNRAFLQFTVPTTSAVTLTMTRVSGDTDRDPDFFIFGNGNFVGQGISPPAESETETLNLTAGDYVVDAHDFFNINLDGDFEDLNVARDGQGDSCFEFAVTN